MANPVTIFTITRTDQVSLTEQERFLPGNAQDWAHGIGALIRELQRMAGGQVSGTIAVNVDGGAKTRTYTQ